MGGVGWEAHRIIVSKEDIYRDREPKTLEYKTSRSPASTIPYTLKPKTLEYWTGRNPYFWSIRMPELAWKKCKQTTFYHSLYSNFLGSNYTIQPHTGLFNPTPYIVHILTQIHFKSILREVRGIQRALRTL